MRIPNTNQSALDANLEITKIKFFKACNKFRDLHYISLVDLPNGNMKMHHCLEVRLPSKI